MTKIKAFKAVKQDTTTSVKTMAKLKGVLEQGAVPAVGLDLCKLAFDRLVGEDILTVESTPAIYIYENSNQYGKQRGVWALMEIEPNHMDRIILHEETITEHANKIKEYRQAVGIEGEPILLTYASRPEINTLIDFIVNSQHPVYYMEEQVLHQLWKVTDAAFIAIFQQVFTGVKSMYVADGHHRLAAAIDMSKNSPQSISTLLMSADQIAIKEFNRLVIPDQPVNEIEFRAVIKKYFEVSRVGGNQPFRPDCLHQLGMCLNGIWYKLTLKPELAGLQKEVDVIILQEYLLKPFFNIDNPREDLRLKNYDPVEGWARLLIDIKHHPSAVAFTLCPMTVDQFLACANHPIPLPPKSTWIEPKIPYGLMMYSSKVNEIESSL